MWDLFGIGRLQSQLCGFKGTPSGQNSRPSPYLASQQNSTLPQAEQGMRHVLYEGLRIRSLNPIDSLK